MKCYLLNKSGLFFLPMIACMFFCTVAFGQKESESRKVKGSIIGENKNIIKGASILVKGTTTGTASDLEGNFNLTVPSKNEVLVVSYIGYKTKEVSIDGKSNFEITLQEESEEKSTKPDVKISGVFDKVEVMPRPKDGDDGWNIYMAKNAKYPSNDRASGIEGTVIVGFEVYEDGSLQNIEILRGIGAECDQEVVRLIGEGPKWHPGMINGNSVKTRMSLPVRFVLKKEGGVTSLNQKSEKIIADQYGEKYVVVVGYQPRASLR